MKKLIILIIVFFVCNLSTSNLFGQEKSNKEEYFKYKNSVSSLYENIIEGFITKDNAFADLDSLKKNSLSNSKEFKRILTETLPSLINKMVNAKKKNDSCLVYTVKVGDNFWKIAKKTLKNSYKWIVIYNANRNQVPSPDVIFPGQKLLIPLPEHKLTQNNSKSQNNTKKLNTAISQKLLDSLFSIKKKLKVDKNQENSQLGINGLIIDETESKIGHDFYDTFYSNWQAPRTMQDYTITISEKPLPRLGAQVTISINDTPIFKRFVQPRYDIIQRMAMQGAATAYSYLENYAQIQKQLQGEDLKGNGIY